jgi:hypothetical protein
MKLLTATGVVDPGERARVESGGVAFVVLPARGRDLAVFGVTRTVAGDARLVAWTRVLDRRLDHDRYTLAIGRFSDRPQLSDVGALALEDEDLNDLRKCRPRDCGVKLSAAEMQEIRAAAAAAGDAWKPATQLAFRRVVVARARDYLDRGLAGSAPYADRKSPVSPAAEFDEIAARVGFEGLYSDRVLPYLRAYPGGGRHRGGVVPLLVEGEPRRRQAHRQHHARCDLPRAVWRDDRNRGRRAPGVRDALPHRIALPDLHHRRT